MKIDNSQIKIIFEFSPKDYFLVKSKDEWSLNYRIDRSFKGKDDDIGAPRIFLTDEEAKICKKSGFSIYEME